MGPNKIFPLGVGQPISDAIKLLTKEFPKFSAYKIIIFYGGPLIGVLLITISWRWYQYTFKENRTTFSILVIIAVIRLIAYRFLLIRWGSNSKYSILGGHRSVAQVISYEVCLVLYLLVPVYVGERFNPQWLSLTQESLWFGFSLLPLFLLWLILCIAESNRTPFDLSEGESELVSGFNIEYGGGSFALIFIREYGIIIFLSFFTTVLFLGGRSVIIKTFVVCFLFVWIRCSFPRIRYDLLIISSWKLALPYSLCMLGAVACIT